MSDGGQLRRQSPTNTRRQMHHVGARFLHAHHDFELYRQSRVRSKVLSEPYPGLPFNFKLGQKSKSNLNPVLSSTSHKEPSLDFTGWREGNADVISRMTDVSLAIPEGMSQTEFIHNEEVAQRTKFRRVFCYQSWCVNPCTHLRKAKHICFTLPVLISASVVGLNCFWCMQGGNDGRSSLRGGACRIPR